MSIDWSKAPEGATHYDTRPGRMPAFMRMPDDSGSVWHYWNGSEWAYYGTSPDWELMAKRPAEWDGQGLPPVGAVCEMHHSSWAEGLWEPRKILFIGKHHVVTSEPDDDDDEKISYTASLEFRPIRTPEQIAAEEREKAIDAMAEDLRKAFANPKMAAITLFDAGYRKQVEP